MVADLPFDSLMIRIYDTDPTASGALPIWGNLTSNRLTGGAFSNIYRAKFNVFDTSRKIWEIKGQIDTILGGGHYWIEWIVGKIPANLANTFPLNTILGSTGSPGSNSLLHDLTNNSFTPLTDAGSSAPQDLPFQLIYDSIVPNPCSGTPRSGETFSDKYFICPGDNFSLFIRDTPLVTGSAYQWELSADSISWTEAPGAILSKFDTSQQIPMYYRCRISCGANVAYSVPLKIKNHFLNIRQQPKALAAECSREALLNVDCSSSSESIYYQWQYAAISAGAWIHLKDGPTVKGALEDSLELQQFADSLNGRRIRVVVKDVCGNDYLSDSVTVQVLPPQGNISPQNSITCEKAQLLKRVNRNTSTKAYPSKQATPATLIPDVLASGISDTIFVSDLSTSASLKAITVRLNMDHPSVRDLALTLKAPNGRIINLLYYMNRGDSNFAVPGFNNTFISSNASKPITEGTSAFEDVFKADLADNKDKLGLPAGPAALLPNTARWTDIFSSGNGNWILGVYDGRTGNTGKLNGWQLTITYEDDVVGLWSSSPAGSLFKDSMASVAYDISESTNGLYAKPDSAALISSISSAQNCNNLQATDTAFVRVQKIIIPLFDSMLPICPGDPLQLPNISKNGIPGELTPTPDNQNTRTYLFTPDSQAGICSDQVRLTVKVIDSCNNGNDFILYPNPVTGNQSTLRLFKTAGEGPFEIQIMDAAGRRVWKKTAVENTTISIPTAQWSEGLYYLSIQNEKGLKLENGKLLVLPQ